jgi:hypothetical protein
MLYQEKSGNPAFTGEWVLQIVHQKLSTLTVSGKKNNYIIFETV